MAEMDPSRWVVIDAMASRDDIAAEVWRTVASRLGL
jgi:thymidylate kinase